MEKEREVKDRVCYQGESASFDAQPLKNPFIDLLISRSRVLDQMNRGVIAIFGYGFTILRFEIMRVF